MPLTTYGLHNKQAPMRMFMDEELGDVTPVCREANMTLRAGRAGGPPVAPIEGADAQLIGTAVEFVLPILHGLVREPRIGAARTATALDQRTRAAELAVAELQRLGTEHGQFTGAVLERAADCALVLARIDQLYRFGTRRAEAWRVADPGAGEPDGVDGVIRATHFNASTRADLVHLLEPALEDTADLYRSAPVYTNPDFALSLAMRGADADLIAGGLLVDFKASKDRSVIPSVGIYQLVGYALADFNDWYAISEVGIHALRWRSRWTISLDELMIRLSGTSRTLTVWRERFASALSLSDTELNKIRRWERPIRPRGEAARLPHAEGGTRIIALDGGSESPGAA